MKIAIVSSAAIGRDGTLRLDAAYWIRKLEEQEEVNRILHLIGEPEEPPLLGAVPRSWRPRMSFMPHRWGLRSS